MSHKATNWAVSVRGIPPAAKVVLWHLADRHNSDTGRCDPSQERLAADCEISRATLNRKLKYLASVGLITRKKRVNEDTKRRETTFYILNFHITKPQDIESHVSNRDTEKPCLISDQFHVSKRDTNPVREPLRTPPTPPGRGGRERKKRFGVSEEALNILKQRGLM